MIYYFLKYSLEKHLTTSLCRGWMAHCCIVLFVHACLKSWLTIVPPLRRSSVLKLLSSLQVDKKKRKKKKLYSFENNKTWKCICEKIAQLPFSLLFTAPIFFLSLFQRDFFSRWVFLRDQFYPFTVPHTNPFFFFVVSSENGLKVPRLLDSADVCDPNRDGASLMTYIACLRTVFQSQAEKEEKEEEEERQRVVSFQRGLSVR